MKITIKNEYYGKFEEPKGVLGLKYIINEEIEFQG